MSKCGFVFILINELMDDVQIIGCSNSLPKVVAREVSRSTGVPVDYKVLFSRKTKAPEMALNKIFTAATKDARAKLIKSSNNLKMITSDVNACEKAVRKALNRENFQLSTTTKLMAAIIFVMMTFVAVWVKNP